MPSYRPQAITSRSAPESSAASRCVNGSPDGVGTTSTAPSPSGTSASSASPHGSGFITMPAPPPYGVSSTVRCRSWVHVRRSWMWTSSSPASCALPGKESRRGARYSGKIVTTSRRTSGLVFDRAKQPRLVDHSQPAAGYVDLRHQLRDERDQHFAAVRCVHRQQVLTGTVDDLGDLADGLADGGQHPQADELVIVVLLGILRCLVGVDVRVQDEPAQPLCGRTVTDVLEPDQQPRLVPSGGADGQCGGPVGALRDGPTRGLRAQGGTPGDPPLWLVGTQLDRKLPVDAVRLADASDHHLVRAHGSSRSWVHAQQAPSPSTRTLTAPVGRLLESAPAVHVDEV